MKKNKIKIVLCGNFGGEKRLSGGQGAKTINLYESISLAYNCKKIDIYNLKSRFFVIFFDIVYSFFTHDYFCICVSRNGSNIILSLIKLLKKIKNRKIYYFCVGICPFPVDYKPGNILDFNTLKLARKLLICDRVFAETNVFAIELKNRLNLTNVSIFKNYKCNSAPLINISSYKIGTPLKIVYFSRIMIQKNPFHLIEAVKKIKQKGYKLKVDFYGSLHENCKDRFLKEMDDDLFFYKGYIHNDAFNILSQYDCLVFTTSYLEGTPSTILDAYFSGIPVISEWFWASQELIITPKCGVVSQNLENEILRVLTQENHLNSLKKNVYAFANTFYANNRIDEIERSFADL